MTGKINLAALLLATCMGVIICFAGAKASSDAIKLNVFERFRNEMTIAHDEAAPKFMSGRALAKWNRTVMPYFAKRDRQLSHFFAFSMLMPKMNQDDFYMSYFNPWVDGLLLTKWKKTGENWKVEDFYFAPGERIRREITPQFVASKRNTLPAWLRQKGTLLKSLNQYYTDMITWLAGKDVREYMSWLSLSEATRTFDLRLLKMRMKARLEMAIVNISKTNSGPALSGAFSKLKYDALTGNKQKLASYSRQGDIIADLPPEITKTWRENWYFKNGNIFTVILSSPIQPRLFLLMSIYETGKIQGVILGDLEIVAYILQKKAAKAEPATIAAHPSTRKMQNYKAPNGDQVEIITEKRGGKVIMTTRTNGKVTEVHTF